MPRRPWYGMLHLSTTTEPWRPEPMSTAVAPVMPRSNEALADLLSIGLADDGLAATWVGAERAVVITGGERLVWARCGGSAPHVANVQVAAAGPGSPWSSFYALPEAIDAVARLADPS